MARIFISYSRKDEIFARRLAGSLSDLGADVWIDVEDIPAGMNWSGAIQQGLSLCEVMIVIISPDSAASPNAEEEWQYYRDNGKPILPILFKPAAVHYQLSRLQYVDFFRQPYDAALKQLQAELRRAGVNLNPIKAGPNNVRLPEQTPLPVRGAGKRNRWIAAAIIFGVIASLSVLLFALRNGNPNSVASIPTGPPTIGPTPTLDIALKVKTMDAQAAFDQATSAVENTAAAHATAYALSTLSVQNATEKPTATLTPTLTPTPIPTRTPTLTETPIPTATPTLSQEQLALTPVAGNSDWKPYEQDFGGVPMMLVPAGCFEMGGDPNVNYDSVPGGRICFDRPFWIDKTEVTNAQFQQFHGVAANPSSNTDGSHPREQITWFEARDYCALRGTRLPTEAEWEYAARGPDGLFYPWGNDFNTANAVWNTNQSAAAGSIQAGASWVGALDLSGNVSEWTGSEYRDYPYIAGDGREDTGGNSADVLRILRGGDFNKSTSDDLRAAARHAENPGDWGDLIGFRCARSY